MSAFPSGGDLQYLVEWNRPFVKGAANDCASMAEMLARMAKRLLE